MDAGRMMGAQGGSPNAGPYMQAPQYYDAARQDFPGNPFANGFPPGPQAAYQGPGAPSPYYNFMQGAAPPMPQAFGGFPGQMPMQGPPQGQFPDMGSFNQQNAGMQQGPGPGFAYQAPQDLNAIWRQMMLYNQMYGPPAMEMAAQGMMPPPGGVGMPPGGMQPQQQQQQDAQQPRGDSPTRQSGEQQAMRQQSQQLQPQQQQQQLGQRTSKDLQQQQDMDQQQQGMGAGPTAMDAAMMMVMAQNALAGGANPYSLLGGMGPDPVAAVAAAAAAGLTLPAPAGPLSLAGGLSAMPPIIPVGDQRGAMGRGSSGTQPSAPDMAGLSPAHMALASLPPAPPLALKERPAQGGQQAAPAHRQGGGQQHKALDSEDTEDDDDDDEGVDTKRMKRKQSNRESARRSRLRRQAELSDIAMSIPALEEANVAMEAELAKTQQAIDQLVATNAVLHEMAGFVKSRGGDASTIAVEELQPYFNRLLTIRQAGEAYAPVVNLPSPQQVGLSGQDGPEAQQVQEPPQQAPASTKRSRKGAAQAAAPVALKAEPESPGVHAQQPMAQQGGRGLQQSPTAAAAAAAQAMSWSMPAPSRGAADLVASQKAAAAREAMERLIAEASRPRRAEAAPAAVGAQEGLQGVQGARRQGSGGGADLDGTPAGNVQGSARVDLQRLERGSPVMEHLLHVKRSAGGAGAVAPATAGGTHGKEHRAGGSAHGRSGSCSSPGHGSGTQRGSRSSHSSSSSGTESSEGNGDGDRSGGDGQSESRGANDRPMLPRSMAAGTGGSGGMSGGTGAQPGCSTGQEQANSGSGSEGAVPGAAGHTRGGAAGSGSDIDWSNMLQQDSSNKLDGSSSDPMFKSVQSMDVGGMGEIGIGMGIGLTSNMRGGSEGAYVGTPDGSVQLGSASRPAGGQQGAAGRASGPGALGLAARQSALMGLRAQGLLATGEQGVASMGPSTSAPTGADANAWPPCGGLDAAQARNTAAAGQSPGQWLVE